MGLQSCNYDFDKGDAGAWCEPGRPSVPPAGERCCECNAPLPPGEKCATVLSAEVYEPDDAEFPPEDVNRWPRLHANGWQWSPSPSCSVLERHGEQMEQALDDFRDANGWDSDYERFERHDIHYRCKRCATLQRYIESHGYCMSMPGELPSDHVEFLDGDDDDDRDREPEEGAGDTMWKPDRFGVWHPCRMTGEDHMRVWLIRRSRRIYSWLRWGWKSDLQWKVWWPLQHRTMRALGYRWTYLRSPSVYGWRKPEARNA